MKTRVSLMIVLCVCLLAGCQVIDKITGKEAPAPAAPVAAVPAAPVVPAAVPAPVAAAPAVADTTEAEDSDTGSAAAPTVVFVINQKGVKKAVPAKVGVKTSTDKCAEGESKMGGMCLRLCVEDKDCKKGEMCASFSFNDPEAGQVNDHACVDGAAIEEAAPAGDSSAYALPFAFPEPGEVTVSGNDGNKKGDHPNLVGWAKDSKKLAFCVENGNTGAKECSFLAPKQKKPEKMSDFDPAAGTIDAAKTAEIQAVLDSGNGFKASKKKWLYANDVMLGWETETKNEDDPEKVVTILRAGVAVNGAPVGPQPPLSIEFKLKGAYEAHVDFMGISPNSKWLGIVVHGSGMQEANWYEMKIVSVQDLVAQWYHDIGMISYQGKEFTFAADMLHRAATMNVPRLKQIVHYDFSCALAQLKDPATSVVLSTAIDLGGNGIQDKIVKDACFKKVRKEAWFQTMICGGAACPPL